MGGRRGNLKLECTMKIKNRVIKKVEFNVKCLGYKLGEIVTVPDDKDSQSQFSGWYNSGIVKVILWG